jgi:hypothetical protein
MMVTEQDDHPIGESRAFYGGRNYQCRFLVLVHLGGDTIRMAENHYDTLGSATTFETRLQFEDGRECRWKCILPRDGGGTLRVGDHLFDISNGRAFLLSVSSDGVSAVQVSAPRLTSVATNREAIQQFVSNHSRLAAFCFPGQADSDRRPRDRLETPQGRYNDGAFTSTNTRPAMSEFR